MKQLFVIFSVSLGFVLSGFSGVIAHWNIEDAYEYRNANYVASGPYMLCIDVTGWPNGGVSSSYVYYDHENYEYQPMVLGTSFTFEAIYLDVDFMHYDMIRYGDSYSEDSADFLFRARREGEDGVSFSLVIDGITVSPPILVEYRGWPSPEDGHHVALVYDGNEAEARIYLNGIFCGGFELQEIYSITLGEGYWKIPEPRRPTQGFYMTMWSAQEIRISDVALLPSQFLCAAIPEPSTLALLALGGGLLAAKRRKNKS